jgi:hypothetical protein
MRVMGMGMLARVAARNCIKCLEFTLFLLEKCTFSNWVQVYRMGTLAKSVGLWSI